MNDDDEIKIELDSIWFDLNKKIEKLERKFSQCFPFPLGQINLIKEGLRELYKYCIEKEPDIAWSEGLERELKKLDGENNE